MPQGANENRPKQQRRLCCVWSAMSASTELSCRWSVASILNWVVRKRRRVLLLSFRWSTNIKKYFRLETSTARDLLCSVALQFCILAVSPKRRNTANSIRWKLRLQRFAVPILSCGTCFVALQRDMCVLGPCPWSMSLGLLLPCTLLPRCFCWRRYAWNVVGEQPILI
jgi:hypothetical protein